MSRKGCPICKGASAETINAALLRRVPIRHIAAQFGLSSSMVFRHLRDCVRGSTAGAEPDDGQQSGLRGMLASLHRLARRCERKGDPRGAMAALKQASKIETHLMPIVRPEKKRVEIRVVYEERFNDRILLRHLQEFVARSKDEKALGYAARLAALLLGKEIPADLEAELTQAELGAPASDSTPAGGGDFGSGSGEPNSSPGGEQ